MKYNQMETSSISDTQSAQPPDSSEPAPHGPEPMPHGPDRSTRMSEPRVEPHRMDPHKVLAYAERRAARRAQDEELKALAYLALIRSGMEERHKQIRKDNSVERKPTQEELDAQLRSIIEESDGH